MTRETNCRCHIARKKLFATINIITVTEAYIVQITYLHVMLTIQKPMSIINKEHSLYLKLINID